MLHPQKGNFVALSHDGTMAVYGSFTRVTRDSSEFLWELVRFTEDPGGRAFDIVDTLPGSVHDVTFIGDHRLAYEQIDGDISRLLFFDSSRSGGIDTLSIWTILTCPRRGDFDFDPSDSILSITCSTDLRLFAVKPDRTVECLVTLEGPVVMHAFNSDHTECLMMIRDSLDEDERARCSLYAFDPEAGKLHKLVTGLTPYISSGRRLVCGGRDQPIYFVCQDKEFTTNIWKYDRQAAQLERITEYGPEQFADLITLCGDSLMVYMTDERYSEAPRYRLERYAR